MEESKYTVNSLSKALDLLDILGTGERLSLAEISQRSGYNKTTCFRLLYTLTENHFVDKIDENEYRLSFKFLKYANALSSGIDIISIFRPFMKELRDRFNQAVHLVILDSEGNGVFLHKENSTRIMQMQSFIGFVRPAHQLATGKMLLSSLEPEELERMISKYSFEKLTPNTIASKEELLKELESIRKRGYSEDNEESEIGLSCIAGPVYDYRNKCVAAISVSGDTAFINEHREEIRKELRETCRKCSASLCSDK